MIRYIFAAFSLALWLLFRILEESINKKTISTSVLKGKKIYIEAVILLLLELINGYCLKEFNSFIFAYLINLILYYISIYDMKNKLVQNKAVVILGIISLISVYFLNKDMVLRIGIGFIIITVVLFGLNKLTKNGIGMGDVKVISALSLYLGFEGTIAVIFLACVMVAIIGGVLLIKSFSNKNKEIPLIPFITVSVVLLNVLA